MGFACKTATFGQEYKSLWVPDVTCRFVHAKQRDLHQNDKSIWVPALICVFWMQNSVICIRMTRIYWFQASPVVLCMQNSDYRLELEVSVGQSPHLWFLHAKQRLPVQNNKSLWVPDMTSRFVHAKQRD